MAMVRLQSFVTVWFGGVTLGLLVALAPRRWWAYLGASGLATGYALNEAGFTPTNTAMRASADVAILLVAALVARRQVWLPFRATADATRLVLLAAGVAAARSFLASDTDLTVGSPAMHEATDAISIALASMIGILVIVPPVALLADGNERSNWRSHGHWLQAGALLITAVVVAPVFYTEPSSVSLAGAFVVIPVALVLAGRFPQLTAGIGLFIMTIGIAYATALGLGPFAPTTPGHHAAVEHALVMQSLLVALPIATWLVASGVTESRVARDEVRRQFEITATAEEKLRLAVHSAAIPFGMGPIDGSWEEINDAMCAFHQRSREELLSIDSDVLTHPDDVGKDDLLRAALRRGSLENYRILKRYVMPDGSLKWGTLAVARTPDSSVLRGWSIAQIVDVTAEVEARKSLNRSRQMFHLAVHGAAVATSVGPFDGTMTEFNDAMCAFLARSRDELAVGNTYDFTHPEDLEQELVLTERLRCGAIDHFRLVKRYVMPDGSVKWGDVNLARVPDHTEGQWTSVSQIVDVTAAVVAREELAQQASHDAVTGLRSRSWTLDALEKALEESRSRDTRVAVMFVDLSEYQVVHRTLGFVAGDNVLADLARRVRDVAPPEFLIGRFDGAYFVVVVPEVDDPESVRQAASDILDVVGRGSMVPGVAVTRSGAIGMALSRPESTSATLLRDADEAMGRAKAKGRSRITIVDHGEPMPADDLLVLESEIRHGLANDEFVLYYQPQVRLSDNEVIGHEALVRWEHPVRGMVPPDEFLGVCEASGLVIPLGRHVLETVCRTLRSMPQLTGSISINVSAVEFGEAGWFDGFRRVVAEHGIDPTRLVVEITESVMLQLTEDALGAVQGLRQMGVGIHVDDFGTGFASVGMVRAARATAIKLDRSFVAPIDSPDHPDLGVVQGIAGLAAGLGVEAIAEGIETPQQAEILRRNGWQIGQGYLFGRPEPMRVDEPAWVAAAVHGRQPSAAPAASPATEPPTPA